MKSDIDVFEQKKVQEVKGSFYIYLPKDWCKKYNIADAKKVFLKQLEDDSLLVRFSSHANQSDQSFSINLDVDEKKPNIDKDDYFEYLFNLYLAAYLIGFRRVIFKKRTKIPMQLQNRINTMTRTLHGMVIVSETQTDIVVEDTSSAVDIKMLIRQMLAKVGLLLSNIIEIIENNTNTELDELIKQDNQVDQYRYAIERQVHLILQYPSLGHDAGISTIECLHYSECTRLIERFGDYITKIAGVLQAEEVVEHDFFVSQLKLIEKTFFVIQDNFERNDSLKLFQLIQEVKRHNEETNQLIKEGHEDKNFIVAARRLMGICADIAEIRINDILSRMQSKSMEEQKNKR
jgi:phosphate uptake regulator